MQEMTGRKPEGGDERENLQLFHVQGERSQRPLWCFFSERALPSPHRPHPRRRLKQNRGHVGALFNSFLHTQSRVLTLQNGSPSWLQQLTLSCLSFIPLGALCFFFFFLSSSFQEATCPPPIPLLSSPKGFPSASDYLWLQLVSRQPSGPVWRLRCALLSPRRH